MSVSVALFPAKFLVQSQFVVPVQLCGLEQTAHFHGPVAFRSLSVPQGLLAFFRVELCVVSGELLQGDEEVPQMCLEPVEVVVVRKQANDETLNLDPLPGQPCTCSPMTLGNLLL